ncbi:MAG: phytoene synthase [Cyclobacteriaceae bacterium]|nr:MAG: phytoene synthase [Cyclobacteriaceae bacterium]
MPAMKQLFDTVSIKCSRLITRSYSTSFSLGILFLDKSIHNHIYAVYGFVRSADEIVDSFHGYPKKELLKKFREDTFEAINNGISLNPILNSFQFTVNRCGIEPEIINSFLDSMEMDLSKSDYNHEQYKQYIWGSAEVVGLMCLRIFCKGDNLQYRKLAPSARKLGSAFQKINFLRDLKEDYATLGRSYFPDIDMKQFDASCKEKIEQEVLDDFNAGYQGIKELPKSARFGVYVAYVYYRSLFDRICKSSHDQILNKRVRIPNPQKYLLLLSSYFKYQFKLN